MLLFLLFIVVCFLAFFLIRKFRPAIFPVSDHCDGKKFKNPSGVSRNILDLIKWQMNRKPKKWPEARPINPLKDLKQTVNEGMQVVFINHSTVLVQWKGLNMITDPIWSERCSPLQNIGPKRIHAPGIELKDLPKIDLILLSHNHYDHLDLPSLHWISKRDQSLIITGLGNRSYLQNQGFDRVEELDWWQNLTFENLLITFVPATHFSARTPWDRNQTLWGGFVVLQGTQYFYFAGDTGFGDHFQEIKQRFGAPLMSLIPIGAYEPRWFMKGYHLSPQDALKAFRILDTQYALAVHFGTFQLTDEGVDDPVRELRTSMKEFSITEERFWILSPGQLRTIKEDDHDPI